MSGPLSVILRLCDSEICRRTSTMPSRDTGCPMRSVIRSVGMLLNETLRFPASASAENTVRSSCS